jgi:hypothetical protein
MNQLELTFTGKELARSGAKLALQHAEAISENWGAEACDYLEIFIRLHPGREFMAEEVREYAYKRGLPKPPSERSWGAVMARAKSAGIIRWCGNRQVTNRKAHSATASLWVGVI